MPSDAYRKFRNSMILDFDAMHDGTGYDLSAFGEMDEEEKKEILEEFRAKSIGELGWREMEVLAADNGSESFDRLRDVLANGTAQSRAQSLGHLYAMGRMNDSVFDYKVAEILDIVTDSDGVVASLLRVQERCGPKTRQALLRGVRDRPDVAIHFASALLDVDKLSKDMAGFDPQFRPTLLKLVPDVLPEERKQAFLQVCKWLKVNPDDIPKS